MIVGLCALLAGTSVAFMIVQKFSAVLDSTCRRSRRYQEIEERALPAAKSYAEETAQVLIDAGAALLGTKQQGHNWEHFFSSAMVDELRHHLQFERDLGNAIEREQLHLFYQPQIDYRSGLFTGVEALLRWRHPLHGWIPPAEFIQIAERTGLILPIGEWVLQRACHDSVAWQRGGHPPRRMCVNLSPLQFQDSAIVQTVHSILQSSGHSADLLELEITESMVVENVESSVTTLTELKSLGVSLSLDDFGTGYSSLGCLKRFPINRLKIDKSFVRGLPRNYQDAAIMKLVIGLAQSLALQTVAEGVETKEQSEYLHRNGCSDMQGFYFARPMPPLDLMRLWETYSPKLTSKSKLACTPEYNI